MPIVNPREYYHEQDRKALEALKAIPGFTTALKAFMKLISERMLHGENMASKVRLGPDQLPEIYNLLPPICETLGIDEPELYLEMDPSPNAYTYGDTQAFITLTSGLLEYMEEDEIKAVIAHECGHIACRHVLYNTMGTLILNGGAELLNLGALALPLQLAFYHWKRCSELSCDRAAAIVMRGHQSVVETMIRLSGGPISITEKINKELYMQQAAEYKKLVAGSGWDKTLQFLAVMNNDHPFNAVRAQEITEWCESDRFKQIMAFMDGKDNGDICSNCGCKMEPGWAFCKNCGTKRK